MSTRKTNRQIKEIFMVGPSSASLQDKEDLFRETTSTNMKITYN